MGESRVIRIMCPNLVCQRVLSVPDTARGKLVRCGGCGVNIKIPVLKSDTPAETTTSEQAAPPPPTPPAPQS